MRLGIDESIEDCISAFDAVSLEDIVRVAKTFVHDTTFFIEGTALMKAALKDEAVSA